MERFASQLRAEGFASMHDVAKAPSYADLPRCLPRPEQKRIYRHALAAADDTKALRKAAQGGQGVSQGTGEHENGKGDATCGEEQGKNNAESSIVVTRSLDVASSIASPSPCNSFMSAQGGRVAA
eukprot:gene5585-34578_t